MKNNTKGLIMSIEGDCAIVLTSKGDFIKTDIKSGQYFVGDEISVPMKASNQWLEFLNTIKMSFQKPALQMVFSLCLVFMGGIGTWAYPVGHVYMDVNPSLGMSYNLYHRVIGMESFNEDGSKIIEKVSYYGKTIDENLENTLKVMNTSGYIKDEEQGVSGVLIGYTDSNLATEFVDKVVETSNKLDKTVQVASIKVDSAAEKIAAEEKNQEDAISPIQATLAARELNLEKANKTVDKAEQARLNAAVKDNAKALKKKATLQVIEENQSVVKVVPNPKVEEVKKKNELKKERIRKQKEDSPKIEKDKPDLKNDKKNRTEGETLGQGKVDDDDSEGDDEKGIEEDAHDKEKPSIEKQKPNPKPNEGIDESKDKKIKQQQLLKEIEKLKTAIEAIQNSNLKENKKAVSIKKLLKQIERLEEELENLSDD